MSSLLTGCRRQVYISASLKDVDEVQFWQKEFAKIGIVQAYDWVNTSNPCPLAMIEAIEECEVFIMLMPGGRGSHIELGVALTCEKPIILVDVDPNNKTLFYDIEDIIHVSTSLEAFQTTIKILLSNAISS